MQKPLYFENEGQRIAGTLHVPEGKGKVPGVILCHGFTGNKGETHFLFVKTSRELARRGIASLRFDFRGSGESEGEFNEVSPSGEISDARRALAVLAEQPQIDRSRLGVIGLSLGGLVAACTAGREPSIRSTVLWAAAAELWQGPNATDPEKRKQMKSRGWVDIGGLKLGAGFFNDFGKLDPVKEIASSTSPVLIIHGKADQAVPFKHAERFYAAVHTRGRKAKLVLLDGVDHTFNRVDWESKVIRMTGDWLEKTL